MTSARWANCIQHRGNETFSFIKSFFAEERRRCLLIVGGGFDPRACTVPKVFAEICANRTKCIILREERIQVPETLRERAATHSRELENLFPGAEQKPIPMFSEDGAVIGGRRAVEAVAPFLQENFTDIIVDFSALSVGAGFPIVKVLLESLQGHPKDPPVNLHLMVSDEPLTDSAITSIGSERVAPIRGFDGSFNLDATRDAVRLWMPQLGLGSAIPTALRLIHDHVKPHTVCPILPFSAIHPRLTDDLLLRFRVELDSTWQVDSRSLVYGHENMPLDLYRSILRIDELRRQVFRDVGGAMTILSPIGRKMLAIGTLLAALDRNLPVMRVESAGYEVDISRLDQEHQRAPGEVVHLWLHGEAFPKPA